MNLVPDSVLHIYVVDQQLAYSSHVLFFDMCLEKNKLKDDNSNDADQVRDLRNILIAAQKNYVLDAPLGDRTIAGADADVMNILAKARYDDYLIVQCTMLYGLERGLQKCFETPWSI